VAEEYCNNEGLHNLYTSTNIIELIKSRRMGLAVHVACLGDTRNVYKYFVGKTEMKTPLRRPQRRWEDNIIMDLI